VTAGFFRTSARAKRGDDFRRQSLDVDFQADLQCGRRIDGRYHLVHAKHVAPQLLVAERVEAEDGLPRAIGRRESRYGECSGDDEDD
jgi:hypothetical protein